MHLHSSDRVEEKEKEHEHKSQHRPSMKKSHNSEALFRSDRRRRHLAVQHPVSSAASQLSINSATMATQIDHDNNRNGVLDDDDRQDILEVWFAGGHGDVGGGKCGVVVVRPDRRLTQIRQDGRWKRAKTGR